MLKIQSFIKVFKFKRKNKTASKTQEFLSKLSKSLMLPIAILPIAGLFLAIGATITGKVSIYDNTILYNLGNIMLNAGDIVFANLQTLFCISIAFTFAKNSAPAALVAFLSLIVSSAIQSSMISEDYSGSFSIMWYSNITAAQITSNLGIRSLQTSVFGGIIIGFLVATIFNKFKDFQSPSILGFFSGVRFVLVIAFVLMIPITFILLMVWPLIGMGISALGSALGSAPIGINSLAFGLLNRALIPFGLHHILNTTFWFSSAGGTINQYMLDQVAWVDGLKLGGQTWADLGLVASDGGINTFVSGLIPVVGKTINVDGRMITLTFENVAKSLNEIDIDGQKNLLGNPGAYTSGAYVYTMFGLPAAAAAMVMAAPKENRKMSFSIVGAAAGTAFLTGITEPIEFTFLFLAPWLYYGIHVIIAGVCFWLANVLGAHVAFGFSSGLIDLSIYGFITDATGAQSNSWILILMGLVVAPIYFFAFFFSIKKWNIATPGRGGNDKLFSKQDFKNQKSSNNLESADENIRNLALNIIDAYGGINNLKEVDACITRLRIICNDSSIVDKPRLISLGASGFGKSAASSVHAIFGTKADRIKNEIIEIIENPELQVSPTVIEHEDQNDMNNQKNKFNENIKIFSPFDGTIVLQENIPDSTFADGIVGWGIAIEPTSSKGYSPIESGKLSLVFPGGHAYCFESQDGTQILVHIGIESVKSEEEAKLAKVFKPCLESDDKIESINTNFANVNIKNLKNNSKSTITPILVLNETLSGRIIKLAKTSGKVFKGDLLFEISKEEVGSYE